MTKQEQPPWIKELDDALARNFPLGFADEKKKLRGEIKLTMDKLVATVRAARQAGFEEGMEAETKRAATEKPLVVVPGGKR